MTTQGLLNLSNTSSEIEELRLLRPRDREHLWRWVQVFGSLQLPREAVCAGHNTPLDYLEYAFFENDPQPDAVVWACRGGGKTMIGAVVSLLDMLFKPGTHIRILGGSKDQSGKMYAYLQSLVTPHFLDMLEGRVTRTGFGFHNGSRVEILAQSHTAVRGTRVQKMRCDEVELFKPEIWSAAQLTTRSLTTRAPDLQSEGSSADAAASEAPGPCLSRGSVEVYSTMHQVRGIMRDLLEGADTPPAQTLAVTGRKIFRWCVWDIIASCHGNRKCETCILWDQCRGRARGAQGFLPVRDVLAMKRRVSPKVWDSEMLCFTPYAENQVFEAFSESMHVRGLPDGQPAPGAPLNASGMALRMETLIAGVDFGWRQFAAVWIAMLRNGQGERVAWVLDEYVEAGKTLAMHARAMQSRMPVNGDAPWQPAVVYCDIAGRQHSSHTGSTSEAELRKAGFTVKSRAMAIEDSIGAVNMLITPQKSPDGAEQPRFFVHPRCRHLIDALLAYQREKSGKPIKDGTHDHIIDALRYGIVGHEVPAARLDVRLY